jgi:hypothetical protein
VGCGLINVTTSWPYHWGYHEPPSPGKEVRRSNHPTFRKNYPRFQGEYRCLKPMKLLRLRFNLHPACQADTLGGGAVLTFEVLKLSSRKPYPGQAKKYRTMQVLSLGLFSSSSRLARAPIGEPKTCIVRYFLPAPSTWSGSCM